MSSKVQVYDSNTKTLSTIPADELAPGYVLVRQEGIGEAFMNVEELAIGLDGPFRHGRFSQKVRDILRTLKQILDEVFPKTLEDWEAGFRRDEEFGTEILQWLQMAQVYSRCLRRFEVPKANRTTVFHVILSCCNNGRETALQVLNLHPTALPAARLIVAEFFSERSEAETAELMRAAGALDEFCKQEPDGTFN